MLRRRGRRRRRVDVERRQHIHEIRHIPLRRPWAPAANCYLAGAGLDDDGRHVGVEDPRTFGLLIIVGAIWGLLAATRLLRREEDAGRWELFLAGRTARRHATVQAIAGLAAGWVVLWTLAAAFTVASGSRPKVDLSVSASLFYPSAVTVSAAMFLAIGALTSQLGSTRRQANSLGAAAFGLSYLIRMGADSGTGLAWMRWASPLGWVENLRPLTG
jgi:ABC-2 type transport system permease protein